MSSNKIKDLDSLAGLLASLRNAGKKIVQCHGVFDLLHVGHIHHFEKAKAMGDVLVVTLTQHTPRQLRCGGSARAHCRAYGCRPHRRRPPIVPLVTGEYSVR